MLERFEWGYVFHDEETGQVECLVVPFRVRGKIRAIRGRAYEGKKGAVKNSRFSLWNLDSLEGKSQAVIVEGESDALRTIQALEARINIPKKEDGSVWPMSDEFEPLFRRWWELHYKNRFHGYWTVEELMEMKGI